MFGLFKPRPPLRTAEKAWVESRMKWLAENLGLDRLLRARVILPTDEHFPGVVVGEEAAALAILDRLCEYMEIDRQRVDLLICTEDELPDATGLYVAGRPALIQIRDWLLDDPEQLVATLAHELAHEILLGGGLLRDNNEDLERLTDLLPAYLGVGAFAANATIRETTIREGRHSWWEMKRHGYLPSRHFGYAMALFAYVRDERDASWARHLRPDVAEPFWSGLKYLRKTDDSLFTRTTAERRREPRPAGEIVRELDSPSPTVRIQALWEMADRGADAAGAVQRIFTCLKDRDGDIVVAALGALASMSTDAGAAVCHVADMLGSQSEEVRVGAAYSLGEICVEAERVVPELTRALDDDELSVVKAAAWSLGQFGAAAQSAMQPLLYGYQRFLNRADDGIDVFARAIVSVADDPLKEVDTFFTERADAELRSFAIRELKAAMLSEDDDLAAAADR